MYIWGMGMVMGRGHPPWACGSGRLRIDTRAMPGGNHSSTQYPDVRHATIGGAKVLDVLPQDWCEGEFLTTVQKRGAAIIAARKLSSAASAAKVPL